MPRQRYVTPYRSPGCANVLCGARADVTDFSYMTLMDKSAVKHNMLKAVILLVCYIGYFIGQCHSVYLFIFYSYKYSSGMLY